jgi:GntR family transcriptional regulator
MSPGHVPLYYQIEQRILEAIQGGTLGPGDQIPTEAELAERHGVSRITAKRALDDLVHKGLAFRMQGKGTFVASRRLRDISGFGSFTEDFRSRGMVPSSRILHFEVETPGEDIRERLGLDAGTQAYRIRRLRMADGEPVAVETAHLSCGLCPGLLASHLEGHSLFALLQERFSIVPSWADAEIKARLATKAEGGLLGMKIGEPVLEARRTTYTTNYEVIECVESVYRGDRFAFFTGRQRLA